METNPFFISAIVPVYNGEVFLAEAVASIQQQDYESLEIIIVDDGSTDETSQIATNLGKDIRYVYQENRGPSAARNKGIALARGDLIAFLDVDDLWSPHKLRSQITHLVENSDLDVVLGRTKYIKLPGAEKTRIQLEEDDAVAFVHLGSGLYKKSIFDKIGGFDETLRFSEDQEWFLRAREQNVNMLIQEQVTLYYRLHEHNMTRNNQRTIDLHLVKALKKSLDRRRSQDSGIVRSIPKFYDFKETG